MNEHKAIARIHDKKRKSDRIDRSKIRVWKVRDDFTAGVLDCKYLNRIGVKSSALFIEYKYIKELPKRDTTLILPKWHSLEQREWANELHTSGHSVLVIIAFGEGSTAGALVLQYEEWNNGILTGLARRTAIKLNHCAPLIERITLNDGELSSIVEEVKGSLY